MSSTKLLQLLCALVLFTIPIMHAIEYDTEVVESLRAKIPGLALDRRDLRKEPLAVTPYGFAQLEAYADSRQADELWFDLSLILPSVIVNDANNQDLNAHPQANITPRRSTFGIFINGPDMPGINAMAAIEFNFASNNFENKNDDSVQFGELDSFVSSPFLRHAFTYIGWESWALLIGQYWHPLVIPEVWPLTVDPEAAVPIEFDSFAPQIQCIKKFDSTYVTLTLASQRSFESPGPILTIDALFNTSSRFIRNAIVPNINLKICTDLDWLYFGAAFDYKRIVPRINTLDVFLQPKAFSVNEHLDTFIAEAFAKLSYESWELRLKGIYAQNPPEFISLGGYYNTTFNEEGSQTYAPINTWNIWSDLAYFLDADRVHQIGIFGGYIERWFTEPLRTDIPVAIFTTLNSDINAVIKIIPRYVYNCQPYVIGAEIDIVHAQSQSITSTPQSPPVPVNCVRFTFQFNYVF